MGALSKVGQLCYLPFTIFQADGVTPWSGQAGACTSYLQRNGTTAPEAVAIAEIGATGHYFATYTPLIVATYDLEVTCPDGRVMGENYDTYLVDIDDIQTGIAAVIAAIAALNDISIADVQTALTNQGYTAARAVFLDQLNYVLEVGGENTRWSALAFTSINDCALMTSARITAYTDPTLTVELRKWDVTATYNPDGSMATYQMVEVP